MIMLATPRTSGGPNLEELARALAALEKGLAHPGDRGIAHLTALETERRRLKSEFSRLVRETAERFEGVKNGLNALRSRCDPYARVDKNEDRSGIAFMDGDQVLQRSRNLIQTLRFSAGDTEEIARLWREYRRLTVRYHTLSSSGMFASPVLRNNAKEALRKVGMLLKSSMHSDRSTT